MRISKRAGSPARTRATTSTSDSAELRAGAAVSTFIPLPLESTAAVSLQRRPPVTFRGVEDSDYEKARGVGTMKNFLCAALVMGFFQTTSAAPAAQAPQLHGPVTSPGVAALKQDMRKLW